MNKTALIFVIVALFSSILRASLSDKAVEAYREAVLKNGIRAVLKTHSGKAYLFEITTQSRTVEALFVFGDDIMKEPGGDVLVKVSDMNAANRVGWLRMSAAETARFFYVLEYSEVLNLAKRNVEDPFKIEVLSQGTIYRCVTKRQGQETAIERKRGDSASADYLFDYLEGAFLQRLETQ